MSALQLIHLREDLLYVVLMHYEDDENGESTSIFTTTRPIETVCDYNTGALKHRKGGQARSRDWRIEAFVGPFKSEAAGNDFRDCWSRSAKELKIRLQVGAQLALNSKTHMFDCRGKLFKSAKRTLDEENNTPTTTTQKTNGKRQRKQAQ